MTAFFGRRIAPLVMLCAALVAVHPAPGALTKTAAGKGRPLTQEEKARHLLDRMTFGPAPGDLARVQALGVKKWIDLQLHPQRIDDSELEIRLRQYPAMKLSPQQLIAAFPSPALIRAVANGRAALPGDETEQAIYRNRVAAFEERKQRAGVQAKEVENGGMQTSAAAPSASTRALAAQLGGLAPPERLNRLVHMQPEEFRSFLRDLSGQQRAALIQGMTPQQRETLLALANPTAVVAGELLETRLLTDLYSRRQLQAVMTDFWLNHFNVYLKKGPFAPWYLVDYEENAIAPHALGKFEDLLVATARSPAMLFYLDNHSSVGSGSPAAMRAQFAPMARKKDLGLNENYARELMELHTLGVNGGYTQKDVTEVAKVFTGWTIADPLQGGGFVFNPRRHEPGTKYVLGKAIPEQGEQEGLEVLHMLAVSPATARHISRELAVRFVSDDPPPKLVERMSKTYLKSGGDIRKVLQTMLTSPEFWSRESYRAKVKTPEEFVTSAVRATGGEVVHPLPVLNAMNELGMPFFGCQTPNGYAWTATAWVNTGGLLHRMNIALALAGQKLGTVTDLDALMKIGNPDALAAAEKLDRLEQALLDQPLNQGMQDAVLQQIAAANGQAAMLPAPEAASGPGVLKRSALQQRMERVAPVGLPQDQTAALAAGLLLGSPEFQRR